MDTDSLAKCPFHSNTVLSQVGKFRCKDNCCVFVVRGVNNGFRCV